MESHAKCTDLRPLSYATSTSAFRTCRNGSIAAYRLLQFGSKFTTVYLEAVLRNNIIRPRVKPITQRGPWKLVAVGGCYGDRPTNRLTYGSSGSDCRPAILCSGNSTEWPYQFPRNDQRGGRQKWPGFSILVSEIEFGKSREVTACAPRVFGELER